MITFSCVNIKDKFRNRLFMRNVKTIIKVRVYLLYNKHKSDHLTYSLEHYDEEKKVLI